MSEDHVINQFGGGPIDFGPFQNWYRKCESCLTMMPPRSVRPFQDDGVVFFVCKDETSCEARRSATANAGKPGPLLERASEAYMRVTGIHWSNLHVNHRAGLQAVLDLIQHAGSDGCVDPENCFSTKHAHNYPETTPDRYSLRLENLTKRIMELEAWRRGADRFGPDGDSAA